MTQNPNMKTQPMRNTVYHAAIAVATLGPPIVAGCALLYYTRVSNKFLELQNRYCVNGRWDIIRVTDYINTIFFDITIGFYTDAVRDQLRRKVYDDHARRTIAENRADERGDELDDGFEEEVEEVQVEGEVQERVVRAVRRGGHRRAARTVYFRLVATLGEKAYSAAQRTIVADHAGRLLREMNVRHIDFPRLLSIVVGMYYTPTREQAELGAMLQSQVFTRERQLVDLPK